MWDGGERDGGWKGVVDGVDGGWRGGWMVDGDGVMMDGEEGGMKVMAGCGRRGVVGGLSI